MPESPEGLPSVEVFARNVTDREGLGFQLLDIARCELGASATEQDVGQRANRMLLDSLLHVGISLPTASERLRRERLFQLLRGDQMPEEHIQECVEYILSQMIIQPKGALAECLAIKPGLEHLQTLKDERQLPANACFGRGAWSHRVAQSNLDGTPVWGEWREAADGLFYLSPTAEQVASVKLLVPGAGTFGLDQVVILGAVEIKCFRGIPRRKLDEQLDTHLARLSAGLQFRSAAGDVIHQEFSPDQIWFGRWTGANLEILPANPHPFELHTSAAGNKKITRITWTNPMMQELVRVRVGPCAFETEAGATTVRRAGFDLHIPFNETELEEMGAAMAFYTLGALADQPEVDLSGAEWSWNLERALESASPGMLSRRQLARREKILRRLR